MLPLVAQSGVFQAQAVAAHRELVRPPESVCQHVGELPIADLSSVARFPAAIPATFLWEATRSLVHVIVEEGKPPLCMRRQGGRGKPLTRVFAKGTASSWGTVQDFGIQMCQGCNSALRQYQ